MFEHFRILEKVECQGRFIISADQIKEIGKREPRLMSKFDHSINLPKIFKENELAILPISRGEYVISKFNAYHSFEDNSAPIQKFELPDYLQSINEENIPSETMAINAALAAGILNDFFEDENLWPTMCGRMGSGDFSFHINNASGTDISVEVQNSQIEIDAAYEGVDYLSLIEAKRDLSDDFLVRQLYYPYRTCKVKGITKKVKPIFFVYSNGIFSLYEYAFENEHLYNSLNLKKCKRYSIESTDISIDDVTELLGKITIVDEPQIAFPQADSFERIVNLCELLNNQVYTREQVTINYAFDVRQTNYYTDAGRYLGLIKKVKSGGPYEITSEGRRILNLPYKKRQLAYFEKILQHKTFFETLRKSLEIGSVIEKGAVVEIMKESELYKIGSDWTFNRRASTVRSWINWIWSLIQK